MDAQKFYPLPDNCNPQRITFQQAIRAKKEQWKSSRSFPESDNLKSSAPLVTIQKMVKPNILNNEERTANGFRESLKFFQSQEERGKVPKPECSTINGKTVPISDYLSTQTKGTKPQTNRDADSPPSVDNILNKVRTICAAQNIKSYTTSFNSTAKSNGMTNGIHTNSNTEQQTASVRTINLSYGESISNNVPNIKHNINNGTQKRSLSSRFNPSFDVESPSSIKINPAVKDKDINRAISSSYSISYDRDHCLFQHNGHKSTTNAPQNLNGMSALLNAEPISLQKLKNIQSYAQAGPASSAATEQLDTMYANSNRMDCMNEKGLPKMNDEQAADAFNENEMPRSRTVGNILYSSTANKSKSSNSISKPVTSSNNNDGSFKSTYITNKTKVGAKGELNGCDVIRDGTDVSRRNESGKLNERREIEHGAQNGTSDTEHTRELDIEMSAKTKVNGCTFSPSLEDYARKMDEEATPLWVDNETSINNNNESTKLQLELNPCVAQTKNKSNNDFKMSLSSNEHVEGNLLSSHAMAHKGYTGSKSHQIVDITEKGCDSLESDYDSLDFVVHKTTYSDDFFDIASEDAHSSVNDDYEVEHPDDYEVELSRVKHPDIPSPDYESDDDDEFLVHQGVSRYEDDDDEEYVVGNSSHYDTRRHLYYPEDKELEVIPEEDEDDLEEEEIFYTREREYSDQAKRKEISTEVDSGIPDDNSSSEDYGAEEDTVGYPISKSFQKASNISNEYINGTISSNWDPTKKLLPLLYRIQLQDKNDGNEMPVEIQEVLLVTIKTKNEDVNLKNSISSWPKEVFAKFHQGCLEVFGSQHSLWPILSLTIFGDNFTLEDNAPVIADHQNGTTVKIHVQNQRQAFRWCHALLTYANQLNSSTYCVPCYRPLASFHKTLLVDLGGTSIRAGVAMSGVSLPTLYFPSVCVTKPSGERIFGIEALKPENRRDGSISFPFTQPLTIQYILDLDILRDLIRYISSELKVQPNEFSLLLVCNRRIKQNQKSQISAVVLEELHFKSIHVSFESYAVIAGYKRNSGIVVEVGDRIHVMPFCRGYEIPFGSSILPYGSKRLLHHLRQQLSMTNNQSFSSIPSAYILRYVMENICYIAQDYEEECSLYLLDWCQFKQHVYIGDMFESPIEHYSCPSLDSGRFTVPEGLFEPSVWGLDTISLSQRIMKALESVPLDNRQEVVSNIILSGGLTLLPGFVERLFFDLCKLLKQYNMIPTILNSDYRLHMSYLGCHEIALRSEYSDRCVSIMDIANGNEAFTKWAI